MNNPDNTPTPMFTTEHEIVAADGSITDICGVPSDYRTRARGPSREDEKDEFAEAMLARYKANGGGK